MKRIFTLFLLIGGTAAIAQTTVPSPSFETWNPEVVYDSLEQWNTSNAQMYGMGEDPNVYWDDTDPQDGALSMILETVFVWDEMAMEDDTMLAFAVCKNAPSGVFEGFPYSDTVNQMNFWVRADVMPNDTAYAIIELKNGGAVYASAFYQIAGTIATWTEINLNIVDGELEVPDSVFIGFVSSDPQFGGGTPDEGSWIEVDNVTLEHTVGSMTPASAVPNYSFEDIYEEEIDIVADWWTFDALAYNFVGTNYTYENAAFTAGAASIEINTTLENVAFDIPSIATNGYFDWDIDDFAGGTPFNAQPDRMIYDYQFTPSGIDTCWMIVQAWNAGGSLIDTIAWQDGATTGWVSDTVDFNFTAAPDSIFILMYSGDVAGSQMLVDNIRFEGGDLGAESVILSDFTAIYPNPSNTKTTVNHGAANQIVVIDVTGEIVYRTSNVSGTKTEINTADWAQGVYLVKIANNDQVTTKKMVVRH